MLLIWNNPENWDAIPPGEQKALAGDAVGEHAALDTALIDSGELVVSAELADPVTTGMVRTRAGLGERVLQRRDRAARSRRRPCADPLPGRARREQHRVSPQTAGHHALGSVFVRLAPGWVWRHNPSPCPSHQRTSAGSNGGGEGRRGSRNLRQLGLLVFAVAALAAYSAACSPAAPSPPAPPGPPLSGTFAPRRFPEPLPPAAEPAPAQPVQAVPAGRLVAVGSAPEGIVVDPLTRTVAVGVRNPDQLTLLNADTGAVTGHVPLPGVLRHLQLAGPGGPVLVPDESSDSLLRVRLPDGVVLSRVRTGTSPHDATQAANGTIFVANEGGGSVVAVRDNEVVHTFTDVTQPAGAAHVGNIVGLIDVRENTITFYDAATLEPITELAAGAGPTHVVADRHHRMIVVDTRGGALLVYAPPPRAAQLTRTAIAGNPYGVTYDPVRDRLWVTATAANQLLGYDMTEPTPREIARLPTVNQPYTVAVDPTTGRLFVTGTGQGTVEIIDP